MVLNRVSTALLAATVCALLLQGATGQGLPPRAPFTNEVFVVFRPGPSTASVSAQIAGSAMPLSSGGYAAAVPLRSGETLAEALKRWRATPGVAKVVPNIWVHKVGIAGAASISGGGSFKFFWPNDTRVADGHGWALERISAGYAWGAGVNGSTPARICIVDTGIDAFNADLRTFPSRVVDEAAFLQVNNVPKAYYGQGSAMDYDGHGTAIAVLIAGLRNGFGTVGLAYGGAELLACKFIGADSYGKTSDAYRCLDWCREQGAHISVNSWGVNVGSTILGNLSDLGANANAFSDIADLLDDWGSEHLFVTAAGNDRQVLHPQRPLLDPYYFLPAQLNRSNMLVVAATDQNDEPWEERKDVGTNQGSNWVHIAAPGVNVTTALIKRTDDNKPLWGEVTGTSFSAALVAGAAALVWGAMTDLGMNPDMQAVRAGILAGADVVPILQARPPNTTGQSYVAGGRRLNVYNALAAATAQRTARFPWLPPELAGQLGGLRPPPAAAPPPYPPLSERDFPVTPGGGLRSPPRPPPPRPPPPRQPPRQPPPQRKVKGCCGRMLFSCVCLCSVAVCAYLTHKRAAWAAVHGPQTSAQSQGTCRGDQLCRHTPAALQPPPPVKRPSPPPPKPRPPPPKPRPPPPKPRPSPPKPRLPPRRPPPPKPRPPPRRPPPPKVKQRPPPPSKKLSRAVNSNVALPAPTCKADQFFDGTKCRSCTAFRLNCAACSPRGCLRLSGAATG